MCLFNQPKPAPIVMAAPPSAAPPPPPPDKPTPQFGSANAQLNENKNASANSQGNNAFKIDLQTPEESGIQATPAGT
jgi:hypothetical protein